jgi:hypothetical protein
MEQEQRNNQKPKMPWYITIFTVIIVLLIVVAVIYLNFFRYSLVGKSIDLGDTTSAALLLSPELAFSLAKIF